MHFLSETHSKKGLTGSLLAARVCFVNIALATIWHDMPSLAQHRVLEYFSPCHPGSSPPASHGNPIVRLIDCTRREHNSKLFVRLEAIATRFGAIATRFEAIAIRLEAEAIVVRLEAISSSLEAVRTCLGTLCITVHSSALGRSTE